jgi:hypothetical protein
MADSAASSARKDSVIRAAGAGGAAGFVWLRRPCIQVAALAANARDASSNVVRRGRGIQEKKTADASEFAGIRR